MNSIRRRYNIGMFFFLMLSSSGHLQFTRCPDEQMLSVQNLFDSLYPASHMSEGLTAAKRMWACILVCENTSMDDGQKDQVVRTLLYQSYTAHKKIMHYLQESELLMQEDVEQLQRILRHTKQKCISLRTLVMQHPAMLLKLSELFMSATLYILDQATLEIPAGINPT